MNNPLLRKIIATSLLLVLVVSAFAVTPALADDEPPPVEPATEDTETPPITPPNETGSDQAAEETSPSTDNTEPAGPETPTADLLSQVPDGTDVIVVDESGQVVPLVTQEAAEIVAFVDPIWCPTGVTPDDLNPACSPSFLNLAALVTAFVPSGNGVIWIQSGADTSGSAITINGATNWLLATNFSLTLKGGWSGTMGTTTTNPLAPSTFSQRITISNWNADVTLSDILISGSAGGIALNVTTSKKITLTRVKVNSNTGGGTILNNTAGSSDVLITFSEFKSNSSTGLAIYSDGGVTLTDVIALGNSSDGVFIDNTTAAVAKPVTITNTNGSFSTNNGIGLDIHTIGVVTLKDIEANLNSSLSYGARITNIVNSSAVTLSGTNVFNDNGYGLLINSLGAIKINNLIANSNNYYGALLDNDSAVTAQPVTLTGSSQFKYNANSYTGLNIYSKGAIALNNITAMNNTGHGMYLVNTAGTNSNITMTGTNVFSQNSFDGLLIDSKGTISLNNVTAEENGNRGAEIGNVSALTARAVTLTGTNRFNDNGDYGVLINSTGAVTLNNVTASFNVQSGAAIDNRFLGTTMPQNVTLKGTNVLSDNALNGLEVWTFGAIAISNLTASYNGTTSSDEGARLDNWLGTFAKPVTLTGSNVFEANTGSGLQIYSLGAIKINSVSASNNGQSGVFGVGAELYNSSASTPQAVTVSGTNVFDFNYITGLVVDSKGSITINSVSASNNVGGVGVNLSNLTSGTSSPQAVTVSGTNVFNSNYGAGLFVTTYGAITTNNLTASSNALTAAGSGVSLNNSTGTIAKTVTVKGTNVFDNNKWDGLTVFSLGKITVNQVSASGNQINGVGLTNSAGVASGITVSGTNNQFDANRNHGLSISSSGAISMANINAEGNGIAGLYGFGAYAINTTSAPTAQPFTLTGTNHFDANFSGGLSLGASGAVKINNLNASENHGTGAIIDNIVLGASSPQNVSITGTSFIIDNYAEGLFVNSFGTISASNMTVDGNGIVASNGYGLHLDNGSAATPKSVTLSGFNSFDGNYYGGLYVSSKGAITVSNVSAQFNTFGHGVALDNNGLGALGNVTLAGTNDLSGNHGSGLFLESLGAVSISNLTAIGNGVLATFGAGAEIYNYTASSPQKVTFSGTNNLSGNYGSGLYVQSIGIVSMNNMTATYNSHIMGVYINNAAGLSTSPQAVTLTGKNYFLYNYYDGLYVTSFGAITLNNITADSNGTSGTSGAGVHLENSAAALAQKVTLIGTHSFSSNYDEGLSIETKGAVTLGNVTASSNFGSGVELYNGYLGATGTVTLSGTNHFNLNANYGLFVGSNGAVTLSNVSATFNSSTGATIDNSSSVTLQKVTLTGTNTFNENATMGLQVISRGLIAVNNLTAISNLSSSGADLYNDYIGSTDGITLTGTTLLYENAGDGLLARSNGTVSLTDVTADGNLGDGLDINTEGSITVKCGFMIANMVYGLRLTSTTSVITLKGVFTAGNSTGETLLSSPFPIVDVRSCP